jgi:hypothetical protein
MRYDRHRDEPGKIKKDLELGFAMGVGIKVIRAHAVDEIVQAHFDTRQYNHIVWNSADELRERLIARINATVPLKLFTSLDRS